MICAFQQFGRVFCKTSRKASSESDHQSESDDPAANSSSERSPTNAVAAPTDSIIIDVSDEEKESSLKRKEPQTDETDEDPDELLMPRLKTRKLAGIVDDDLLL